MNATLAVSPWILDQGRLFLTGLLAGAVLHFAYDLLRLWRRILPRGTIVVAIEDVVFFFLCAMAGFEWLYPMSLGQLKGFLIVAICAGATAYHFMLGRHLIRAVGKVIYKVRKRIGKK